LEFGKLPVGNQTGWLLRGNRTAINISTVQRAALSFLNVSNSRRKETETLFHLHQMPDVIRKVIGERHAKSSTICSVLSSYR